MYLYSTILLTKLPRGLLQTPSYFSSHKFSVGQIVEVPLGKRHVPAIILSRLDAHKNKQTIRKSDFALRSITRELVSHPIFEKRFLDIAAYLADYYFVSTGLMLRRMLPPFFSKPTAPLLKMLEELPPTSLLRSELREGAAPRIRGAREPKSKENKKQKPKQTLLISTKRNAYYKKLSQTKGGLFLVPEYLGLSALKKYLKNAEVLEKNIRQTKWRALWGKAYEGEALNILGTRAALFTPVKDIKNIVVENENNPSHKSWDQHPKFDSRFAARVLSKAYGANITMADSIPSIETYWRAKKDSWNIIKEKSPLAKVTLIDMREELKQKNTSILSHQLQERLRCLGPKSKIFLFINRRGISSALLCRDCGKTMHCPDCDAPLVVHQSMLICHHCSRKFKIPFPCPFCRGGKIKRIGAGTQKVEEEIKRIAPHLKTLRLDSDVAPKLEDQEKILESFKTGECNVLIGTTLALRDQILPKLDTSAIVMFDTILNLPSYKSSERVHEVIWRLKQLTRGEVFVQTYNPDLPVFTYADNDDFELFFSHELEKRRILNLPPFSQFIKLTYGNKNSRKAEEEARILKQKFKAQIQMINKKIEKPLEEDSIILGPAPAFIPKVKNNYIWYILIKWPKDNGGEVINLKLRNKILSIAGPDWDLDVDPIDVV